MTRANLIPTVITDVNGKTTTVHRRAEAAVPSTKALPQPSRPGPKPYSIDEGLTRVADGCIDRSLGPLVYADLKALGTEGCHKAVGLLEQREYEYRLVEVLSDMYEALPEDTFLDFIDKMNRSYYELKDVASEDEDPNGYSPLAVGIIRGVQAHDNEMGGITPEQSGAISSTMASLLHATKELDDYPEVLNIAKDVEEHLAVRIGSQELLQHVMDNPEDSSVVSALINEKPTLSEAELLHLLKNPAASKVLSEGAL